MSIQVRWALGYMLLTVAVLALFGAVFYYVGFQSLSNRMNTEMAQQGREAFSIVRHEIGTHAVTLGQGQYQAVCLRTGRALPATPFRRLDQEAQLTNTSYSVLLEQLQCTNVSYAFPDISDSLSHELNRLRRLQTGSCINFGAVAGLFSPQKLPTRQVTECSVPLNSPGCRGAKCPTARIRVLSAGEAINLPTGQRDVVVVSLWRSLDTLSTTRSEIKNILLILLPLAAVIASILGLLTAMRVTRPLRIMTRQVRQIAKAEDLSVRVPSRGRRDEIGQLAAAFNGMMDRLQGVFDQQRRFVGDASHEMRTPLTAIIGNTELLDRELRPAGDAHAAVATIRREAGRMSRLVNDLLTLAELDFGPRLVKSAVELDTVLMEVCGQARYINEDVRVRLGDVAPVIVQADPDRIRQLLLNLVDNAVKYTPAGGMVTLAVDEIPGGARISVSDTGIGIPKEDLTHIFERFYRADKARSGRPGAGLGLSICRWIVEAHAGTIRVESTVGVGTTFFVELPASEDAGLAMTANESAQLRKDAVSADVSLRKTPAAIDETPSPDEAAIR